MKELGKKTKKQKWLIEVVQHVVQERTRGTRVSGLKETFQLLLTITLEYKGDRSSVVVVVEVGVGRGYRHTCEGPAAVVKTDAVRLNSTIFTM